MKDKNASLLRTNKRRLTFICGEIRSLNDLLIDTGLLHSETANGIIDIFLQYLCGKIVFSDIDGVQNKLVCSVIN